MCLKTVDFALEYDNSHEFVGYGYKRIAKFDLDKYKNWTECLFTRCSNRRRITSSIYAKDSKVYPPGFHIFLNKIDAERYNSYNSSVVVIVKYKNVIAFGINNGGQSWGPCIIARHMKIVEVY